MGRRLRCSLAALALIAGGGCAPQAGAPAVTRITNCLSQVAPFAGVLIS
ncbi:MAG: hypothetical protein IMZ46_14070 [Acidobacteria bacterium]|nr:hypothetical protein [Acidobacteriota bacterium]